MRNIIIFVILLIFMALPVQAMEFTAPEVPDSGKALFPEQRSTFGEDLKSILRNALDTLQPSMVKTAKLCSSVFAAAILLSVVSAGIGSHKNALDLAGALTVSVLLLSSTDTLIRLGTDTVQELSQYGKLFIPVMTGALAAQGAPTASGALYAATVLFDSLLTHLISGILIPLVYIYLAFAVAHSAIGEEFLKKVLKFMKWFMTWCLKGLMYLFTGYITVTGVISGSVDSAAIKATKLTISGAVPVIGGILSDASEAVLVSAGMMKSTAGVYGILSFVAIGIGPFLQIGAQYLLLKATSALTSLFGTKRTGELVEDFSTVMGFVLGMTGATALILMISTVCFMKGIT